jgi:uncharacterized protein
MYKRSLTDVLKRFSTLYPIVGITGPRQSGKTTLARTLFPHLPYVSLENLDTRKFALDDPREFLAGYKQGAILDEVQNTPDILSYLQQVADETKKMGEFVITGSQNFVLSQTVSQSLPGRVGMTTLLPLSLSELKEWASVNACIFQGGYPGLHNQKMTPQDFYPSYIQTYLERDVRELKNVENLTHFQTFLKLCAGRTGQLLNISSLANDCGISPTTARHWLTILEASYIVFLLPPFHHNFNKRIIKMPKLYFYDTGLACNLLGLEQEEQFRTHYMKGAFFENLVILEVLKHRLNRGLLSNLYFWRDQSGHEIDLIGDWGGIIHMIEIKSGATFQSDFSKGINYFSKLATERELPTKGYVVYGGNESRLGSPIQLLSLEDIDKIFK